jgi:hypothetical protein
MLQDRCRDAPKIRRRLVRAPRGRIRVIAISVMGYLSTAPAVELAELRLGLALDNPARDFCTYVWRHVSDNRERSYA